jgi:SnoaL-like domain
MTVADGTTTTTTTARWRAAGEAGDAEAAGACLDPGIVVISPLTAQFTFRGLEQVVAMLTAAFQVIDHIQFHTEVGTGEDTRALFSYGTCGKQPFEEAQLLRFGPSGLITELTLFGRPLPGLTAVLAGIGPVLLKRKGRRGEAGFIAAAVGPLHALARLGERRIVPLGDPARPAKRPR